MKKSLIKEVSSTLKSNSEPSLVRIDELGSELYSKVVSTNFVNVVIYLVFLVLSTVLFDTIDHLSFLNENNYFVSLAIFAGISVVIAIIFFTLYIYNKKKQKQISLSNLKKTYRFYQIYDLFSFVSVFVTVFFWIILFVVSPVEVSGTSMEDTYHSGDKILVWHMFYEPKTNDVVIIDSKPYYTGDSFKETDFVIKRVVALSGDTVKFETVYKDNGNDLVKVGVIYVNGEVVLERADITLEDYKTMLTDFTTGETYWNDGIVPEGHSIVFGDNVTSLDSKSVGLINNKDILGVSIFRIYPFDKIGVPTR